MFGTFRYSNALPRTRAASPCHTRAFTLIETILAILIMALLASAVAFSLTQPIQGARLREALSELQSCDSMARQNARQSTRPVRLAINPSARAIERFDGEQLRFRSMLPVGCRITQVIVGRHATWIDRATVTFSASGLSRTYAIRLQTSSFDRWLLFSGLSGQMILVQDEQTLRTILDGRAPPGRNAD
jgi:prepilin-type N-terminal cleavage/methylation domain-containing protein